MYGKRGLEIEKGQEKGNLRGMGKTKISRKGHGITTPDLLSPGRYITALRMKTNKVGLQALISLTTAIEDINCQKCKNQPETLGHMIGLCTFTKPARMNRLVEILNLIVGRGG